MGVASGALREAPGAAGLRAAVRAAAIHVPKSDELTIWTLCGAAFMSLALTWAL